MESLIGKLGLGRCGMGLLMGTLLESLRTSIKVSHLFLWSCRWRSVRFERWANGRERGGERGCVAGL